jgi:hypothetical protein
MGVFSFHLSAFSPFQSVTLRELNGHDEYLVHDSSTFCALQLINGMIVQPFLGNSERKIMSEKITVSDRDYLMAGIYKYTYGSKIESSLSCSGCGEKYDLDFSLDDLIKHTGGREKKIRTDEEGFFCSEDGLRLRLPNGEDELAVWGAEPEESAKIMLTRCVPQINTGSSEQVMELMEELGPVLTTDISANCPECGSLQIVQFDIQQYLLTKIRNERKKLAAEVHSIAFGYGWSHKEILDLPRSMRQTYAGFINHG